MCIDLATNSSWTRVNTHLVLLTISVLLNITIIIFHNNGHETKIESTNNELTKIIFMGMIDELHYFPLAKIEFTENIQCPKYTNINKIFHQWVKNNCINN
jgi:hypothetical protein